MSASLKSLGAITLFVQDQQRSKSFYEDVFGLPVLFEDEDSAALSMENLVLNLLRMPAASDLIEPGVVAGPETGSRFQLTIWVEDVNGVCSELAARGVGLLNGPIDREWGMRTAGFTDPDGHIWEVAEKLPTAEESGGPRD